MYVKRPYGTHAVKRPVHLRTSRTPVEHCWNFKLKMPHTCRYRTSIFESKRGSVMSYVIIRTCIYPQMFAKTIFVLKRIWILRLHMHEMAHNGSRGQPESIGPLLFENLLFLVVLFFLLSGLYHPPKKTRS